MDCELLPHTLGLEEEKDTIAPSSSCHHGEIGDELPEFLENDGREEAFQGKEDDLPIHQT
jgi:hypothetical protein